MKVACLLFKIFWTYKISKWKSLVCIFALFLCVKSFCKKRPEIIPNNLIYIATLMYGKLAWYSKRKLRTGNCGRVRQAELWTQPSLEINVKFFLWANGWISYITKSQFRSVEHLWTHLHIANNLAFYHGLCVHQPRSQGFFPNAEIDRLSSIINRSALGMKHWERGWVSMHHCWVLKHNKNKQFLYNRK